MILDNFSQCDLRTFSFNFYKKKLSLLHTYIDMNMNMTFKIYPNFIFVWDK